MVLLCMSAGIRRCLGLRAILVRNVDWRTWWGLSDTLFLL